MELMQGGGIMETRYYPAKSGKWRIEISGTEDDAKIGFFGAVPRHVRKDCERFNCSGYKYSLAQLERYAKQFI